MHDMNFREKYRNVHECDPFYYHPLHLPEYCADMFEKLIRSRIGSRGAVRVLKQRNYSERRRYTDYLDDVDVDVEYRELTPYEQMFLSLNKDVEYNPSNGQVVWSNLGPVAVYRQPISRGSKDGIYEFFKKTMPKERKSRRSKKNGLKMDFNYGKKKIMLNIDKNNDKYVIYDV